MQSECRVCSAWPASLIHLKEKDDKYTNLYSRLEKYEDISDRMEIEIGNFLNRVAEGRLSPEGKMRIAGMLRIISEIESIADKLVSMWPRHSTARIRFMWSLTIR